MNVELTGGRNALHFAADYGHVDIIEYLISKGANVNVSIFLLLQSIVIIII